MTRLIIFDFSGTLAYHQTGQYREVAAKLRDFNLQVGEEQIAKLEAKLPEYFSESSGWKELTDKIIQKLGIVMEFDRREALEVFVQKKLAWKLFGDVEDVVSLSQDKAILTLSGKFAIDSIPELQHFTVFPPQADGVQKPDPRAFQTVLKKMKAKPEETLMVGDTLENDILPAQALGIKAILLDRDNKIEAGDSAITKITSLKELKSYL